MLPAPLSVSRPSPGVPTPSVSTVALSRSSEEGYTSDIGSQQRLVSPQESMEDERYQSPSNFEARVSRSGGVLRQGTVSAQYPGETPNAYQYSPQTAGFDDPSGLQAGGVRANGKKFFTLGVTPKTIYGKQGVSPPSPSRIDERYAD